MMRTLWTKAMQQRVSRRLGSASVALACVIVFGFVGAAIQSAQAQTYKETVLYTFTGGPDGETPWAGLISDAKGNFYATTNTGGASNAGVVFKVSSKGEETVLYSFTGAADGDRPYAGLISDAKGNLYGTTYEGGASNAGVVFKVSSKGKETVLHSFTGPDGANPYAGLIWDAKGNLYGTTAGGGASGNGCLGPGCGTVFKLSKDGQETVLYSFTGGRDGGVPVAGLLSDAKGNLYGTTLEGGDLNCNAPYGCGTVFKVTPNRDGSWSEIVLYRFKGRADGGHPWAGLISDAKGNLYGTTAQFGSFNDGVVFKVSSEGKETVLYSFTVEGDQGSSGGLIWDAQGNLYGTTVNGGVYDWGTVFKLSSKGKETVLYNFTGMADGGNPNAGLIWDAKGNLYCTTLNSFPGAGVVFKLSK